MRRAAWLRFVDSFPSIVVGIWSLMFVLGGTTLPIDHEIAWRIGAGVVAAANFSVAVMPYSDPRRFAAGVVTVTWLVFWVGYLTSAWVVDNSALAERISPWGVTQFILLAVFVAWTYGRRPMGKVALDIGLRSNER